MRKGKCSSQGFKNETNNPKYAKVDFKKDESSLSSLSLSKVSSKSPLFKWESP